ncbi:MAG: hypothetical protein KGO02_12735 [Alphaproteobacteria bacterium]|nr:hypothetical protein [Alphaproteobacteria bacterium]
MYPSSEHHYDAFHVPTRHEILEEAFEADVKHSLRHWILEIAAILAPAAAVGAVVCAILITTP